jgi:riboflavin kinase/FMN adenylyltransferase
MADAAVEVVGGVRELRPEHGPLFAVIGVFDGLHLGHQYLLRHLVAEARLRAARPAVITFDSHPDEILVGAAPPLLLDHGERLRLLGEAGVEIVVVEHFDDALRATEYDDFIHGITERTALAGLLMTPDAAFGHDRRGTPDAVRSLGRLDGFDLVIKPPFQLDGRSVRSSDIRSAIASGDLALAERLLGRAYTVVGRLDGREVCPPMPVATPSSGDYLVTLSGATDDARPSHLQIGDNGRFTLMEPPPTPTAATLRLVFMASGAPPRS